MKDLINSFYRNHALIYKAILFILTTALIVYFFPKSGKFRYTFEKGKPWQSENLYAPFDFPIKKSEEDLETERQQVLDNAQLYFEIDQDVRAQVVELFADRFEVVFPDTLSDFNRAVVYGQGINVINSVYEKGLLDKAYDYQKEEATVKLAGTQQIGVSRFADFISPESLRGFLEFSIDTHRATDVKSEFLSIFFDVLKPNASLNESLTQNALEEELNQIGLFRGQVERETLIIAKGEVVEGEKLQVLKSLEEEYKSQVWSDANYSWIFLAYTLLVALALLMLLLFLRKYRPEVYANNTKVTFIFFNIVLMVILTTLVVNFNSAYLYLVPICILPLVLKAFFDARLGLFTHVITVLLLGFIVTNSYEYMFLQIIAGIVTILTVSELYKRANLFISVGQITLIYILAYFAFFVIHEGSVETLKWETFLLFILCGLATLFVLPLIYVYEKLFGLVSDVSLLELSDTNSKLLKDLSNKAPGTFHHSLNVANLAEAAANEIGANAMLSRVGALYHDIGKMKNPTFFTENQSTGINPHNELPPKESAKIIIDHVIDGIEMAKRNNLPDRVIDFIRTHHGTNLVYYFYTQEMKIDEETDRKFFQYPGPKPFSKETAILMMCDSVEAASKSLKEPSSSKIDGFVESIINRQMEDDQFINADITFKEIQAIKKILKHKLANIYHLRIEYPDQ